MKLCNRISCKDGEICRIDVVRENINVNHGLKRIFALRYWLTGVNYWLLKLAFY